MKKKSSVMKQKSVVEVKNSALAVSGSVSFSSQIKTKFTNLAVAAALGFAGYSIPLPESPASLP